VALAEAFHSKFILVGRTSISEGEQEWARDCPDEKSLKQKIISRMREQRQRATPVEADRLLQSVLAGREVRRTLQRIEQNNGKALYCRADITDGRELLRVLEEARSQLGEVDALIHGAGNIADRKIEEKTAKDFDRVFACKVLGLQHLLECLDLDRLRSVVLFSSVTSLWGNAGQTDYAMANALLDKFAQCSRFLFPEKSVVAVHWGPWDFGMVTPALKKIYREKNIGLISRAAGSRMAVQLYREKARPQTVLCETFAIPPSPVPKELQPVQVQRTLVLRANPFLQDHCIDGHPVLPATCAIQWMTQTGEALLPGQVFRELRGFKVLKGIVFQKDNPKDYVVQVEPATTGQRTTLAIKIISRPGRKTVYHYSGEIVLSPDTDPGEIPVYGEMDLTRNGSRREKYYRGVPLFHGKSFQGIKEICNISPEYITVYASLPPLDDAVQGQFKAGSWNPYVTDVQLQSILLWSGEFLKAGCLPASIGRIEQFRPIDFGEDFYVSTRIQSQSPYRLLVEIITHDSAGKIHARWTGVQLTVSPRLLEQFRKNRPESRQS
jgi:NAD(P)-dependent dehydrogenase (short-subunit alcohol dehydrogenase family)